MLKTSQILIWRIMVQCTTCIYIVFQISPNDFFCLYQILTSFNKLIKIWFDWFIVFNATFSYIMATSFSGGRSWSTQREAPTMGKQLVNFITCGCESIALFFFNLQSRVQTHAVLMIGLYELLSNPTHWPTRALQQIEDYVSGLKIIDQ